MSEEDLRNIADKIEALAWAIGDLTSKPVDDVVDDIYSLEKHCNKIHDEFLKIIEKS